MDGQSEDPNQYLISEGERAMALFIHQCDSGGNPNSLSARSLKERARAQCEPSHSSTLNTGDAGTGISDPDLGRRKASGIYASLRLAAKGLIECRLVPNVWSAARLQGKSAGEKTSLRKCIRPLRWRTCLLARMSCARVCPYKSVGCSFETNFGTRLQARRCDCSVVLAAPMQTSVGKIRSSS